MCLTRKDRLLSARGAESDILSEHEDPLFEPTVYFQRISLALTVYFTGDPVK